MIEIKLQLFDEVELAGLQAFYAATLQRRLQILQAHAAAQAGAKSEAANEAAQPAAPEELTDAQAIELHTRRVKEAVGITPAPAAEPAAPEAPIQPALTPREIFNQYLQTHGFAAARKKLDAFGAQRFSDLKTEQFPAFLKSLVEPA